MHVGVCSPHIQPRTHTHTPYTHTMLCNTQTYYRVLQGVWRQHVLVMMSSCVLRVIVTLTINRGPIKGSQGPGMPCSPSRCEMQGEGGSSMCKFPYLLLLSFIIV